jgi:trans-aconitate 2-methyltransferase
LKIEDPKPPAPVAWDAATYHAVAAPQESWGLELADAFPWRGDETILDAGCGSGRLSLKLLDRVPRGRLIGVDANEDMIRVARQTLAESIACGRVEVHLADLLEYRSPPVADVVFSCAVIHWILDHDRFWRNCHEWLKPGGWLWAQGGGEGNIIPERELIRELAEEDERFAVFREVERGTYYAGIEETRARLEALGIRNLEVSLQPKTTAFETREAFSTFVTTVILRPYAAKLGKEIWKDFVDLWTERHIARHGPRIHYVRLNVRAQK